jgi:hypothetical protein
MKVSAFLNQMRNSHFTTKESAQWNMLKVKCLCYILNELQLIQQKTTNIVLISGNMSN